MARQNHWALSFFWAKRLQSHTTRSHHPPGGGCWGCLFGSDWVTSSEHSVGFTGTQYHGSSQLSHPGWGCQQPPQGLSWIPKTKWIWCLSVSLEDGLDVSACLKAWVCRPAVVVCVKSTLGIPAISQRWRVCCFAILEMCPSLWVQPVMLLFLSLCLSNTVKLGVLSPNVALLFRGCWPLPVYFNSVHHSTCQNPISQSSWTSPCSGKIRLLTIFLCTGTLTSRIFSNPLNRPGRERSFSFRRDKREPKELHKSPKVTQWIKGRVHSSQLKPFSIKFSSFPTQFLLIRPCMQQAFGCLMLQETVSFYYSRFT